MSYETFDLALAKAVQASEGIFNHLAEDVLPGLLETVVIYETPVLRVRQATAHNHGQEQAQPSLHHDGQAVQTA